MKFHTSPFWAHKANKLSFRPVACKHVHLNASPLLINNICLKDPSSQTKGFSFGRSPRTNHVSNCGRRFGRNLRDNWSGEATPTPKNFVDITCLIVCNHERGMYDQKTTCYSGLQSLSRIFWFDIITDEDHEDASHLCGRERGMAKGFVIALWVTTSINIVPEK